LHSLIPIFATYVMSFAYVGIYWNNHHHMMHATSRVTGPILWANLHLLFWLSLIPFVTGWMGENHFASQPTALFGVVLLLCSVAYLILQSLIIADQGPDSRLRKAVGRDLKGKFSMLVYALAIGLASVNQWISIAMYWAVAVMWFIPDRRIETQIAHDEN